MDRSGRCPVCGGTEHDVMYDMSVPYNEVSIPGWIARCRRCPMWFKIPAPQVNILDSYAEGYADAETNVQYMLGAAARRFFRRTLGRIRRRPGTTRPRLLDIGTGMGALLEEAAALGFDAEGIDVSAPLVDRARGRGLRVHHGPAETLEAEAPFDVITLLDVIEHVTEPRALLATIQRLLKPDGELVVYTPNHRAALVLLARALHRVGVPFPLRAIFGGNHLGFFDDRSLPLLLRRAGFEIRRTVRSGYDPDRAGLPLSGFSMSAAAAAWDSSRSMTLASAAIRTIELLASPFGRTCRLLIYARPLNVLRVVR